MIRDILISPVGREFDMQEVKSHLASIPHAAIDPVAQHTYMLATSDEQLERAIAARTADPTSFPYSVALVDPDPERIDVSFRDHANVATARRFVQWLRASYETRIMDEAFKDLTSECDEGLEYLFGPST